MSESNSERCFIKVQAPRPSLLNTQDVVDGWPVQFVENGAAIRYCKFTSGYQQRAERPWKLGTRSFKTLPNALRALATDDCTKSSS